MNDLLLILNNTKHNLEDLKYQKEELINNFNNISSIGYLKSKINLETKVEDEKTFFKTKLQKIPILDEKLQITKEDLRVYNSILKIINEERQAQLKTQSDLETLQNSQKIKSLGLKIYEIDK